MRKYNLGIVFVILSLVLIMVYKVPSIQAQNDRVEDVQIQVTISEDGSARIKEHRIEHNYTGTERYIIKENLGKSDILDFKVSMNNQAFEFMKKWDIDASFEDKAFKHGIIPTKNGYELAWGTSETGRQEYVVEYTVTNFIKQLTDAQILYWNFFMEDVAAENIRVEIETPKQLNEEDEGIWGFGFPGDVYFENGNIVAYNTGSMDSSHHVTILVQFREQIFSTGDKLNQSFEEIQSEAFEGSNYSDSNEIGWGIIVAIILLGVFLVFGIIVLFIVIIIVGLVKGNITSDKREKFKKKFPGEYYRDQPYEGYYLDFYYISYRMGLSDFSTVLTSILLKWIKEERIRIEEDKGEGLFRRANSKITLLKPLSGKSIEGRFYTILSHIAGEKQYLYDIDLSKYASRHYNSMDNLETLMMNRSKLALVKNNLVKTEERKVLFSKVTEYLLTEAGEKTKENTYKYVNYLSDFSLLHERESINVLIWDELMIWASFLNLTKEVQKEFRKLYPKYDTETLYQTTIITSVTAIATKTDNSRNSARSEAARSSGSGGSTSIGGGGGSFGGGGSGGRR